MSEAPRCVQEASCPGPAWANATAPSCDCMLRSVAQRQRDATFGEAYRSRSTLFRGAFATWSNFPRHSSEKRPSLGIAFCGGPSAGGYRYLLRTQLRSALRDAGGREACKQIANSATAAETAWRHLVVVNAWNEWGEQAVLEPTVEDGSAMLEAHRKAIEDVERELGDQPW